MTAAAIIAIVRSNLAEATARYWTDAELLAWMNLGAKDLWRRLVNTHQDYFHTSSVAPSIAVNTLALASVPTDVSIVIGLEPVTPASYPTMNFFPRRFTHPDMIGARAQDALDPASAQRMFYAVTGAGAPVGAPTISVAPKLLTAVPIRLTYVPTCPDMVLSGANPVPGESDNALCAWTTAYALGKEPDDKGTRIPDPGWLTIYGQQADSVVITATPRQDDEPDVAEGVHDIYMDL